MKFSRIDSGSPGIWGVLVLTPLYFIFDMIGRTIPRRSRIRVLLRLRLCGLAFQIIFDLHRDLPGNPVRLRPMMILRCWRNLASAPLLVLYLQNRCHRKIWPRRHRPSDSVVLPSRVFRTGESKTGNSKAGN